MDMDSYFANAAADAIELRHALHMIPEIAGEETGTSALLRRYIASVPGVKALPPFLGTDVVVLLQGGRGPGKNVTLRADIDGLPITETTGLPYASHRPGMMHACGHDAHAAMLFGALEVLAAHRDEFAGSVRFVWQPGEESKALARELIAAGALNDPVPDYVEALHVFPRGKFGTINVRRGVMNSSSNHFVIVFKGRGGHGSDTSHTLNPINAMAAAIVGMQSLAATRTPFSNVCFSICKVTGGSADNIIPDQAECTGTIRATTIEDGEKLATAMRNMCENTARAWGCECDCNFDMRYLPTVNDDRAYDIAVEAAKDAGLELNVLPQPALAAEDFCYFTNRYPGVLLKLGVGVTKGLHNQSYNTPDEVLVTGIKLHTQFALTALAK